MAKVGPGMVQCVDCGEMFMRTKKMQATTARCAKCIENRRRLNIRPSHALHAKKEAQLLAAVLKQHEYWVDTLKTLPANYHTLTEDEWIAALRHFNGKCAMCGEGNRELLRSMFMRLDTGVRYCDCNVIPVCTKCASLNRQKASPFRFMNDRLQHYYYKNGKFLQPILDYLGGKIYAATGNDPRISIAEAEELLAKDAESTD